MTALRPSSISGGVIWTSSRPVSLQEIARTAIGGQHPSSAAAATSRRFGTAAGTEGSHVKGRIWPVADMRSKKHRRR